MLTQDQLPDWCTLTGIKRWCYRVNRQLAIQLPAPAGENIFVHSSTGQYLGRIRADGLLTIEPGYAFDGATCAPDNPCLMLAIVVHDILCQCCDAGGFCYSRSEVDEIFLDIGLACKCKAATAYYAGIALFGGVHRLMARKTKEDLVFLTRSVG